MTAVISHPRAGQAVRPAARRRRHRPRRAGRRRLRLPRRQRLGQDDDGPHAARPGAADQRRDRAARRADAPGRPAGAAAGRRADRGPGALRAPVRPGEPRRCSTPSGPRRLVADPAAAGRRGARAGRAGRRRPPAGQGLLARACGSGSGWPARCCAVPSCWCSTSRPTAWTRRASPRSASCCSSCTAAGRRSSCPATCWPRSSSCATRVGVLDRGRLVLQDELATLTAPDRLDRGAHPGARPGARRRWTAGSRAIDGERVDRPRRRPGRGERAAGRRRDPGHRARAGAADAGGGGARRGRHQHRPGGGDRRDRRRAAQDVPPAAHLGDDRRPQRAADRWWRCCCCSPTWRRGRGRGRRSCPPCCATARSTRWPRWRSCCRCSCRSPSPSSRATRSPGRRRPARCATCSPARRAAPGCWSPSWSPSWRSCWSPCVVVAGVGYVARDDAVRRPADRRARRCPGTSLTSAELAGRTVLAIGYVAVSMLGVAAFALFFSTLTDSPLGATMGALAVLVASSLLFTLDAASPIAPYLPTRYWLAFVDLFRDPILWRDIIRGARRCRASTSACCSPPPGRTSRPRTSRS